MPTAIHRQVAAARAGDHPLVIRRMLSGWAVAGQKQVVRGYCLLLPDPVVPDLNALDARGRARFLSDMVVLGDALLQVTGAARINYEILGNLEPALHAHVIPRYASEPEENRAKPIWSYDWTAAREFDIEEDGELAASVSAVLDELLSATVAGE